MSAPASSSPDAAQPHRLSGGLIDRSQRLRARFDGREIVGFAGDTLASALLANGVRLVGRSFKYHRPRGIVTAGPEEPNALVELRDGARREPNTRATTIEMFDGLEAASQNRWPSLRFDLLVAQLAAGAVLPGRLLLQDLHVAALLLGARLRTADPSRRRPRPRRGEPDPDHYEQAYRVLRRLDHRRRAGRASRRAKRRRGPAPGSLCASRISHSAGAAVGRPRDRRRAGTCLGADVLRRIARPVQCCG